MSAIQIIVTVVVALLGGGLIGNLLNLKKIRSETEVNNLTVAQGVVKMMEAQMAEQKEWYDWRIAEMQGEINTLRNELALVKSQLGGN